MSATGPFGLSPQSRARLLDRVAAAAKRRAAPLQPGIPAGSGVGLDVSDLEHAREFAAARQVAEALGLADPYFRVHDGIAGAETMIGGRALLNFSSYDYLGLNGHADVATAAKAAIDRWGTSVSASRPVSGERPIHRALEHALARVHGTEDSLVLVGGHSTNVTLIGHLLGHDDVIIHDALIHNSIVEGARLSGARRLAFPHLDHNAADRLLGEARPRHDRALIVVEGHYSMDGDLPDLPAFIAVARRHHAWIMVDEAHALGVLGRRGFGTAEHFGADPAEVDIWMGTLSKTLVSCGGYIAGRAELIGYLKLALPGFVFSVGMAPPLAAAALAALGVLEREPERVQQLNDRARLFLELVRAGGLDAGGSVGAAIVPIITGSSVRAARLAQALFERGINVQPILYPAVPEDAARLRFFLTAAHSDEQIRSAARLLIEESGRIDAEPSEAAKSPAARQDGGDAGANG